MNNSQPPTLDPKISPSLVKDYAKMRIYNPALPAVHERIADIVKDVITKYDIDGIHFDDYFYPDPENYTSLDDAADYQTYGAGYTTIEAFRRGNVDKVVQKVHDVIVQQKPGVVFSISPTANNDYNFNTLFADVTKWCQEGWIDVIIPQIYSATGNTTSSFNARVGWWPQYAYKAVLMIGYALYKFGDTTAGAQFQSTSELVEQFRLANLQSKVLGSVMYNARSFNDNKLGIIDVLKRDIYKTPAVIPFAGRKTLPDPAVVSISISGNKLSWDATGDLRFVVYRMDNNKGIVTAITSDKSFNLVDKGDYCVTVINKDNVESAVSNTVTY